MQGSSIKGFKIWVRRNISKIEYGPVLVSEQVDGSLPVVWASATHFFQFPREDFAGAMRVLRAPEAGSVRRMCGRSRSRPSWSSSLGSKWSLLLRIVLQDALSEDTKIYPSLKLECFVDDITHNSLEKEERGAGGVGGDYVEKLKKEVKEKV